MSKSNPLQIVIVGARGRMGQAIAAAATDAGATIAAALDVGEDLAAGIALGNVVIDFSAHATTAEVIRLAVANGQPLVIGTTGHAAAE